MRDRYADNVERVYGFSSEKKMASVLIGIDSAHRLYTKARYSTFQSLYKFAYNRSPTGIARNFPQRAWSKYLDMFYIWFVYDFQLWPISFIIIAVVY